MEHFQLKRIPEIHFGLDSLQKLPKLLESKGETLTLITGRNSFTTNPAIGRVLDELQSGSRSFSLSHHKVSGEPSPETIGNIVDAERPNNPETVIAIGGGSVLDTGKAVSAMLTEQGSITDYLEGVGTKTPGGSTLHFIAVPTTAGTGSEATANSVITKQGKDGFKKSLRHNNFVPQAAIIDPKLTIACPPEITASCGMDCYSQLVEGYLSSKASVMTDSLALPAIAQVQKSLVAAYTSPEDLKARSSMAYAAMISGIVLANAGLGLVHGLAPPLGSGFSIPHGVVCGTLMASVNRANVENLENGAENPSALEKYTELGRLLSPDTRKDGSYLRRLFLDHLEQLTEDLKLPRLGSFGVSNTDLPGIASNAGNKNNPVLLDTDEIKSVLQRRL